MSRIRDQIAAKRAEAKASTPVRRTAAAAATSSRAAGAAGAAFGAEEMEDKTATGQVKKAARSGRLDISSLELHRFPPEAYTTLLGITSANLTRPPSPPPADPTVRSLTASFHELETSDRGKVFGKEKKEEVWVECEELVGLRAGQNRITELEVEIGAFGGLKSIDLKQNLLTSLPVSFADLLKLTSIDLSYNEFTSFPAEVLLLPALTTLDLSHNHITTIDFSSPIEPSDEGLAYGAGFLSTSFSRQKTTKAVLPVLRSLNLGYNRLQVENVKDLSALKGLRNLNLEGNRIQGAINVDELGIGKAVLRDLTVLNLSGNPGLTGTEGDLTGVEVDLENCGATFAPTTTTATSIGAGDGGGEQKGTSKPPIAPRPAKPSLPVPNPDLTLVYRYLPAATFDSEPLSVDLDLYLPSEPSPSGKGHPLVIWFHGGGLLQGNKENLPPHFRRLPSHSYPNGEHVAVISPNYRLAPQVPIIDILSDVTALLEYIRTKLNDRLKKEGKGQVDTNRICLSGGSAGGYLALIAGLKLPSRVSDEEAGGYKGEKGIKCIAPFYPITDLEDPFWATETNPVPWWGKSVPHQDAKAHLDLKAPPVFTAKSGGPRSILYPYMLQHGLFPSLLFLRQKAIGQGLDGFRPSPQTLSITHRLETAKSQGVKQPPVYFVWGEIDDKVQPMGPTLKVLEGIEGVEVEKIEGGDHQFDEDPGEECEAFREWLGRTLL